MLRCQLDQIGTRLHSGEGTVGFKMVGDLFVKSWLSKILERHGGMVAGL